MGWSTNLQVATNKTVPLIEARQLAAANQTEYERLEARRVAVQKRFEFAKDGLDHAYGQAFDGFLAPFAEAFARLKNVDMGDLRVLEAVPELAGVDVEMQQVAVSAVKGLASLAGGSAVGASAGALTFSAVGMFAAASTGTAIGSLSGAAATSATLAWLGGGSLAAGGGGVAAGTAVLTGMVAAPVLLAAGGFLYWQGKKSLNEQRRVSQRLKQSGATLARDGERVLLASKRYRDTTKVTRDLTKIGEGRLPAFNSMLGANNDYARYSPHDRAKVAELAGLAQAVAAVLGTPILDKKGVVTESAEVAFTMAQSVVVGHAG